jgi:6-pyruvoyltetrahydropterin/6-carboxytetrahydropterin synthase
MFTISKSFSFEAAHSLPSLPDGHKCKRYHGHSYVLTMELQSADLDQYGFVVDYGEGLDKVADWVAETVDHRDLNEVFRFHTSVENLAFWIFSDWRERIPQLVAVRVSETPRSWAEYRP